MPKNPKMHADARYVLNASEVRDDDGVLRATEFDDVYFSVDDGLAEARHVFLAGNNLSPRMAQASHLTIAETGFGSGLNLLAVMQEMSVHPQLQLDFISVEAHPLQLDQMQMVHNQFAELTRHAEDLRANLPPRWPGHHCVHLMDGRVTLHLLYGDAAHVLGQSDFMADAWFLDGFTPARNPRMWSEDVLAQIARLTAPGGSFATFTAAASVRTGLAAAGFDVSKAKGFGRKRDMVCGVKVGAAKTPEYVPSRIGIIGGGIAGAAVAAGLRRRGAAPILIDRSDRLASGGSGNRLALQTPRLAVDHNAASRMSAACLAFAARLADSLDVSRVTGVISLDCPQREAIRHQKFRSQEWPADLVRSVSASQATYSAKLPMPSPAMHYDFGRVIDPVTFVTRLSEHTELHSRFCVEQITTSDDGVIVTADDGRHLEVDAIVLAMGADMGDFLAASGIDGVSLDVTSGQVSHLPATEKSASLAVGLSFGGYVTPAIDGIHELGATFDRSGAMSMTDEGHRHNLTLLPEALRSIFESFDRTTIGGRVSQRASMPDRNPIAGMLSKRIYGLGALGARGFTVAPLLGDMLAAEILGRPNTMERDVRTLLDPFRFRLRGSRL